MEVGGWNDNQLLWAAMGSIGGVGGGGISVPMLALILGFDPKSSTALSKGSYFNKDLTERARNMEARNSHEEGKVCT